MRYLSLFSGIGGFELGMYRSGIRCEEHYFSEIDEYAINVYRRHFPEAIALGDVRGIEYGKLPGGEWLATGGFPCQPHSVRGKRKGAGDQRNLWPECARMLRQLRPACAVFENVTGLFVSDGGEFFNRVLSDISEGGYSAEWQVISAQDAGAPHRRERVWVAAYPSGEQREILLRDKISPYRKNGTEKYSDWQDVQFKATGAYSIQLQKGDVGFVCRMDDGIPPELDKSRICVLGNSIVPQCAERIFRLPAFDRWRERGSLKSAECEELC
ncbi:hypothetical protein FACS189491_11110 [Spirochaetia bacterium]|nr:hypothetical protein FACS189491_11110 [Spirochaetia bacterium]